MTISATPEQSTLVMIQALTHTHLVSIKPLQLGFHWCFCLKMTLQFLDAWGFILIMAWFPAAHESSSYATGDMWSSDIITRCLLVSSRVAVTQEQISGLFDLIPGMDFCEMQRDQYGFSKGYTPHTSLQCYLTMHNLTKQFKGLFSSKLSFVSLLIHHKNIICDMWIIHYRWKIWAQFCLKWINILTQWGCIILKNSKDLCSLSKY